MESAEIITLIVTTSKTGAGTDDDPVRIITRYWSLDGELLFEK